MIEPIWVAVAIGIFLVGVLVGALGTGLGVGKLFDVLLDGLSLELGDEIERRFRIELINQEYESVAEPRTDALDQELAHAPRL